MAEAIERIHKLADSTANPQSDSNDLIHAFGDVEELRYEVAAALLELVPERQAAADTPDRTAELSTRQPNSKPPATAARHRHTAHYRGCDARRQLPRRIAPALSRAYPVGSLRFAAAPAL